MHDNSHHPKKMEDLLKTRTEELAAANLRLQQEIERRKEAESRVFQLTTESKRGKQALRESEKKYQKLFENVVVGIVIATSAGNVLAMNRAFEEITGYSFEAFSSVNLTHIYVNPEDRNRFLQTVQRLGRVENFEVHLLHRSGRPYWASFSSRPVRYDNQDGLLTTVLDITKRRRAEERIEGLSRLKEELLGSESLEKRMKRITDGVVEILGADFARIWLTQQGDRCDTGCLHAEVFEGPHVCRFRDRCLHLISSSGRYTHTDGAHQRVPFGCYKIGRVAAAEERGFLTNDVTRDPRVHNHAWARQLGLKSFAGYRLISHEGTPIGVLALFSQQALSQNEESLLQAIANTAAEVIQGSRIMEEMARLNKALEAKNTELEQVVYVASHDLRSPLVNIDGYSRELAYDLEDLRRTLAEPEGKALPAVASLLEKDIPESLRFIRGSASKMDTLLSGLLRLSRSGRAVLTMKSLDMNDLMANVVDSFEYQIREAHVQMEVAKLPPCRGDGVQLNQVFSNLLSNALKYLDPGRPGVIQISGRTEGKHSVYCMADNGIGISENYLEKIFEIFHRLDPDRCEGDGLGLTIVKRIIGRLDGSIRVESEEGYGTRFYVALPTVPA